MGAGNDPKRKRETIKRASSKFRRIFTKRTLENEYRI